MPIDIFKAKSHLVKPIVVASHQQSTHSVGAEGPRTAPPTSPSATSNVPEPNGEVAGTVRSEDDGSPNSLYLAYKAVTVAKSIEESEKMIVRYRKRLDTYVRDEERGVGLGWGRVGDVWGFHFHSRGASESPKPKDEPRLDAVPGEGALQSFFRGITASYAQQSWSVRPLKDVSLVKKADAITLLPRLVEAMDKEFDRRMAQLAAAEEAIAAFKAHVLKGESRQSSTGLSLSPVAAALTETKPLGTPTDLADELTEGKRRPKSPKSMRRVSSISPEDPAKREVR